MFNKLPFLRAVEGAGSGATTQAPPQQQQQQQPSAGATEIAVLQAENATLKSELEKRDKKDGAVERLTALGLSEKQARRTITNQAAFDKAKGERAAQRQQQQQTSRRR